MTRFGIISAVAFVAGCGIGGVALARRVESGRAGGRAWLAYGVVLHSAQFSTIGAYIGPIVKRPRLLVEWGRQSYWAGLR